MSSRQENQAAWFAWPNKNRPEEGQVKMSTLAKINTMEERAANEEEIRKNAALEAQKKREEDDVGYVRPRAGSFDD